MTYLIKLSTLLLLFTSNIQPTDTRSAVTLNGDVTVQKLSKKWKLEKYKYLFFSEDPEEKEKNDYIHLKSNMTFSSITEGDYDEGTWELDAKNSCIILKSESEEGVLPFIVEELTSNKMVLYIYDPSDDEAEDLKIHFKAVN